jgi:Uncharacterized conserved protein
MKNLVDYSRKYGSDPELVLAGGGNTSMKENGVLYVKGSGCALSSIKPENFVKMDIVALRDIVNKEYPSEDSAREAAFLKDCNDAKLSGEEEKRPSVEALLHALFPQRYVLHLHPALVNGLTCGKNGEAMAKKLFPTAIWVPACKPGYTLAKLLADKVGENTDTVLLQNHGVFFAAETPEGLANLLDSMMETLKAQLPGELPNELEDIDLSKPFSPDHIVYCGLGPNLPDNENARLLYRDAQKINWYSKAFGGPHPLPQELVDFITHWEAESYRKKQSK